MESMGETNLTEQDLEDMMAEADVNGDGYVDYEGNGCHTHSDLNFTSGD